MISSGFVGPVGGGGGGDKKKRVTVVGEKTETVPNGGWVTFRTGLSVADVGSDQLDYQVIFADDLNRQVYLCSNKSTNYGVSTHLQYDGDQSDWTVYIWNESGTEVTVRATVWRVKVPDDAPQLTTDWSG